MLARLAGTTGGRLTRATNDLSLGFARVQRDLGCRYTVGFYLAGDREDVPRDVALRVKRPGLRVLHPDRYMFRSESAERSSGLVAAFLAPEMFETGYVRAHAFALHPATPKSWETLLAISFPVRFDDAKAAVEIDFGGVLRVGANAVHSFNRRVSLQQRTGTPLRERRFTFLEPVALEPGSYELTVVTADAGIGARPEATRVAVDVPVIPRKELLLVQPILGRPRDENIVVRGTGPLEGRRQLSPRVLALLDVVATKDSFEPLLVQRAAELETVYARNKACLVATRRVPEQGTIRRSVRGDRGKSIELDGVPLDLERSDRVLCQNVFEELPEEEIEPGRYRFEAVVEDVPRREPVREALRFAIDGVGEEPPAED